MLYPSNDQGIPVMAENALRWTMMVGTYLEVEACLGAALVHLLGGFQNCGWFWNDFGDWIDFGARECEWLRGAGALRQPMDLNRSFLEMSTLKIVLAALKIFRHIPDFRASVSCLGLG